MSRSQDIADALACVTIPKLRAMLGDDPISCPLHLREDAVRVATNNGVRALSNSDRALGRVPQGQARHAQDCRFLLNAARVRQHYPRPVLKSDEVKVSHRL